MCCHSEMPCLDVPVGVARDPTPRGTTVVLVPTLRGASLLLVSMGGMPGKRRAGSLARPGGSSVCSGGHWMTLFSGAAGGF